MGDQTGIWIRYCTEHRWLSPTFYTHDDWLASHAVHGRAVTGGCLPGTVGRLPLGTAAAVVAGRLPDWAREQYWGTVADRYFEEVLGDGER